MAILALLFIVVPIAEIYLIIEIGGQIGTLNTLAIMVVTAVTGAWLAKHQGLAAVRDLQRSALQGQAVGRSLVEAALVLVAAVTMLTPGFLTDFTGLALLVPPVRRVVAAYLTRRIARRMRQSQHIVIDVDGFHMSDDIAGMHIDDADPRGDDQDDQGPGPRVIDV